MDTNGWFDYGKLGRGSVIAAEQIEQLTKLKRGTDAYSLQCMALCQEIKRELRNHGTRVPTVVVRKHDIFIANDPAVPPIVEQRLRRAISMIHGVVDIVANTDRNGIEDEVSRRRLDRAEVVAGYLVSAMAKAPAEIPVQAYQRELPLINAQTTPS